eukprot:2203807-Pleurochrysis_carterae.AAC.1
MYPYLATCVTLSTIKVGDESSAPNADAFDGLPRRQVLGWYNNGLVQDFQSLRGRKSVDETSRPEQLAAGCESNGPVGASPTRAWLGACAEGRLLVCPTQRQLRTPSPPLFRTTSCAMAGMNDVWYKHPTRAVPTTITDQPNGRLGYCYSPFDPLPLFAFRAVPVFLVVCTTLWRPWLAGG